MSLALAAALALAAPVNTTACSWDRPGIDPFRGDLVQAVDRYTDIPAPVRQVLKQRMAARQYDEIATIKRDRIEGRYRYAPELRGMHFGNGRVCADTSRSGWSAGHVERGLVYCESGHCVIVPTVCRNLSRVTRLPQEAVAGHQDSRHPKVDGLETGGAAAGLPALLAIPGLGPVLAAGGGGDGGLGGGGGYAQTSFAAGSGGGLFTGTGPGFMGGGGSGGSGASGGENPTLPGSNPGDESALPSNTGPTDTPPPPGTDTGTKPTTPGATPGLGTDGEGITGPWPLDPGLEGIPAVPEPGTVALWLAGLGVVTLLARRRRSN